ncbi:MAG: hypothetical protein M1314_00310 [Firmicutes bacterium]|nr:hypothetical protein [Bacillota bacterium]
MINAKVRWMPKRALVVFAVVIPVLLVLASGIGAAAPTPPQRYYYYGGWQWQAVSLTHVTNVTVEDLPDAAQVGELGRFRTDDPQYTCLNGENLNVWTAPAEFPGDYVVHNGAEGPQCTYGTWVFPAPPPGGLPGISSGVSVATVTVDSVQPITGGLSGLHYQMYDLATDPNAPYLVYPISGSFGAGNGCSSNCWTERFAFPSASMLTLSLTLEGSQNSYGSEMTYVSINGGGATDTIEIAGVAERGAACGIALWDSICEAPVGEANAVINTAGNSGNRTAAVQITIQVQEMFAF